MMPRNLAFMVCFSMAMTLLGGCNTQSRQATAHPFMGSTASPARAADVSPSKPGPRATTVEFMPAMLATCSPGFRTMSTLLDSEATTLGAIEFFPQFASTSSAGFNGASWFATENSDSVIVKSEEHPTSTSDSLAGVETDE